MYAIDTGKEIVPVRMEPRYNAHGWLLFVLGGGFRHDFSDVTHFDQSMRRLVDTIHETESITNTGLPNLMTMNFVAKTRPT